MKAKSFLLLSLFTFISIAVQAQMPPPPASPYRTYVSVNGNDSNASSGCQQIAPCRNFNIALGVTASHGELVALDSGNYMPFNITQSVTIKAAPGADVTILSSGFGDAIAINAGSSDSIVLHGLTINGSATSGWTGIHFWTGGALLVENCVLSDLTNGIRVDGPGKIIVTDTLIRDNQMGVAMQTSSGQIHATFDRVHIKNNQFTGIGVWNNTQAVISNSLITDNFQNGIEVSAGSPGNAVANIEGCIIKNNNNGIVSYGGSLARVSHSTITDNMQGIPSFGGQVLSFGNNRLVGNVTDGFFTGMVPLQ
ncbi:MAG: hypothetical protein DMG65_06950 [Candidatus Angelobacter sp. Gp1-AA117]|nr:MAG: hypothetical protein DMG65_06950 [Candidatus Angelobacter sp. Gp1-AA117]